MKQYRAALLFVVLVMLLPSVTYAGDARIVVPQAQVVFRPLTNCSGDVVDSTSIPVHVESQEKGLHVTARLIDSALWDNRIVVKVNRPEAIVILGKEPVMVVQSIEGNTGQEINLSVQSLADRGMYWVKVLWTLVDANGAEKATAVTEVRVEAS